MHRRQRRSALPHPVFTFLGREIVEIEEHVPGRQFAAKTFQRRCSPQAARVGMVLPNVEYLPTPSIRVRDVVGPVEDGFDHVTVGGKALVAKSLQRYRVLRFDPSDGP